MSKFMTRFLTALCLIALCVLLYMIPSWASSLFIAALLLILLTTEWPRLALNNVYMWLLTPFYPVLPCIIIIALNQESACRPLLALAIILASMHDSASYISGNLFGRHLIAPTISPLKTWEGFFGGCKGTLLVFMAILSYWSISLSWYILVPISLIVSILSFYGDLFESWLKRKAHVKDSGNLLPGHGGILDRIDSILFVATFMYIFRRYLSHILGLAVC
jgi:phosphatidate cytidylyltransferase